MLTRISVYVLLSCGLCFGQATSGLQTLPELIAQIPHLPVNNPSLQGTFSESLTAAYYRAPASFKETRPAIMANLRNPEPEVQFQTLITLSALTMYSGDNQMVLSLADQISSILRNGSESSRLAAMLNIGVLGQKAPDVFVPPLEFMLQQRDMSERLTIAAAGTLMDIRPQSEKDVDLVASIVNDPTRPVELRGQVLGSSSHETAGPKLIQLVVSLASSSPEKQMRDVAISCAESIGQKALTPLTPVLKTIANDATESAQSKHVASNALKAMHLTVQ